MKLTSKLIGYLNRVFDKTPSPVAALRLDYAGSMTWTVADGVLSTVVSGGPGASLQINLAAFTISSLATYLAAQSGYTVTYSSPDISTLNARVLLDASGDPSQSNGDLMMAYTSLLWAWLDPAAKELKDASDQIDQAVLQMVPQTASGEWLDELGMYYSVDRLANEPDGLYAPRIVAEVKRSKGNNIAIAAAISDVAGGETSRVTDAPLDVTSNSYGLFDVDIDFSFDRLEQYGMDSTLDSALIVIERMRDAGTHLRNLRAVVTYQVPLYFALAIVNGETTFVLPYSVTELDTTVTGPYWAVVTVGYEKTSVYPA